MTRGEHRAESGRKLGRPTGLLREGEGGPDRRGHAAPRQVADVEELPSVDDLARRADDCRSAGCDERDGDDLRRRLARAGSEVLSDVIRTHTSEGRGRERLAVPGGA